MSLDLSWLPPLILLTDYDRNWELYFKAIYQQFHRDFVQSKPAFPGKRFALKRHPLVQDKEATFWHLISSGDHEDTRQPDLRRCERIGWPRRIIEDMATEKVRSWPTLRGQDRRLVLALFDFSYVVVLADRGDYILLWTAYCVEENHRRRKLQRECEEAQK